MAMTTDGAPGSVVDPGAASASWDTVLSEGITSTGVDPNSSFDDSQEPTDTAPQTPAPELSAGTADSGSPAAPQPGRTGDDGVKPDAQAVVAPITPAPADQPVSEIPDAKPFTFTVDGTERTIDGAFVLPGDGLYVPEARIPHFQMLASRAESSERQLREMYDKSQSLERLTEWRSKDAQGKDVVFSGSQGIEMRELSTAMLRAENAELRAMFDAPPTKWLAQDAETGEIVWNTGAFAEWNKQLDQTKKIAFFEGKNSFAAHASAPPPPQPALSDAEIMERAPATVDAVINAGKITGLTAEDKTALGRLVPAFKMTVTRQNAAQFPNARLGETVLDYPRFLVEVQDRAALRASAVAASNVASQAGKFNGGMNAGRAPVKVVPAPKKPTALLAPPAKVGKAEAWDSVLQAAMADIVV